MARDRRRLGERPPSVAEALLSIAPRSIRPASRRLRRASRAIGAWRGAFGALLHERDLWRSVRPGPAERGGRGRGVPIVALELATTAARGWYRMRQERLLGEALARSGRSRRRRGGDRRAAATIRNGWRMGEPGARRMGPPGGARAIARAIAELAA